VGTLRRNPDLKWRYPESGLAEICAQQRRILDRASQCVRPGGRLVYATCSFLPEENEQQIQAFLDRNPNFELADASIILNQQANLAVQGPMIHLRPDQHQTDAFFAAVMTRKAAPVKPLPLVKPKAELESRSEYDSMIEGVVEIENKLEAQSKAELEADFESLIETTPKAKPKPSTRAKKKTKE
jgi:hypothetical protein